MVEGEVIVMIQTVVTKVPKLFSIAEGYARKAGVTKANGVRQST